jgi:16S rRNA (cytidine1402-2'-O)-methyltransferase
VSAPLTAAIASGFPLIPLTILGFAPSRAKDRVEWLRNVEAIQNTVTFFETPHRIAQTMAEAATILGERQIVIGRELTKAHQEFLRGTARELAATVDRARGEFTVVVGPVVSAKGPGESADASVVASYLCYSTEVPFLTRRAAISATAKRHGLTARDVYRIVERHKITSNDQ